jgi:RNA polymerase sigma-70 factor (ECF subfamily)
MRLELGDVRGHTSTLAERLGTGKLLQTGGLERIVNTGHFFCVYRSIGLLTERDGENVETPINLQISLAERATVNPFSVHDSSDDDLVRAAQGGDRSAFGLLYERYARMVHGILLGRVPPSAVEDLVQDVFLRAMPRVGSLRDVGHFGGWLAAIARNRAADFFRQSQPGVEQFENSAEAETESKEASAADKSEALAVLKAIRILPEAYREPLILRLVEGMTGPEIAAHTGLTHGSVRVNLHRGMQQLRQILDCGEGDGKSAVKS